ncbi:MAG: CHAT domain-containing tetratricopeptide repeat protein [Bacteroidota bacterium]
MRYLISAVIAHLILVNSSFAQLGDLLKDQGVKLLKKEGKNILQRELSNTKNKFDSTSFSYAISLSDKAAQFESKDKLADVVTVSTMLIEDEHAKTDVDKAREYMDIGEMAYSANGFKLAESSFVAATAILVGGGYESDPLYGRGLANMGLLYNSMGRYAASKEFTTMGLNAREEYRGKNSKDYAASLNNLAVLNKDLGNYNQAEKEISEAIEINKQVAGNKSIAYAISLNNRGVLYQTLGRYENAERDMILALEVASNSLKSSSLQYTRLQSNLALLYQQQGKYDQAEAIYKAAIKAIARNPTKSKKSNPDYAHMIENLASLYEIMDKQDEAEALYLEALAVYEKKFDNRYSGYGLVAARLGSLYLNKEDLQKAEKYLLIAEGIMNNTFGSQHPYTVDLQIQLGVLNWHSGDDTEAFEYFVKALDKSLEFVGEYFAPMSDTEKAMYWHTLQPRFEKFYAFAAGTNSKEVLEKAIQYRIATKAMLLSGTTRVKSQILNSGDSTLIKNYQSWLDLKGSLAHYYSMSQEDLKEQKVNLDSLNRASNALEKSLSEQSGLFNTAYHSSVPELEDIITKLKDSEKAVELIRISDDTEVLYLAIIISKEGLNKVVLSNGSDLEDKHFKLYRNMIKFKKEDKYSYAQYWEPIDRILGKNARIYISPDGVYNQISINSLQTDPGRFVLDQSENIMISSLRDLMNLHSAGGRLTRAATLFGNPDYGSTSIDPLPGTGKEVSAIKGVLDKSGYSTTIKTEENASEDNFKGIDHKGLVHIATHGFFVPDPRHEQTSVFSIPLYNVNENVLLRSGILLAGAGNRENEINDFNASNNGVLTSYEVMNLQLDNSDLVVLSACETGLGDLMSGEGVYGLQRAFMIAGASSVVMSLWKVDDEATQKLMVNFYKTWLKTGNLESAFRTAQKTVRTEFNHPYYWGAFVLLKN